MIERRSATKMSCDDSWNSRKINNNYLPIDLRPGLENSRKMLTKIKVISSIYKIFYTKRNRPYNDKKSLFLENQMPPAA